MSVNFVPQRDQMDCGPACLSMITSFYGKQYPLEFLRKKSFITREGVSMLGITEVAEAIGFKVSTAKLTVEKLIEAKDCLPCILHWNQNHFVVLKKIRRPIIKRLTKKVNNDYSFYLADPGHGHIALILNEFNEYWRSDENRGVALFLEPTSIFYNENPPEETSISIKYLFNYLRPFRKQLLLMFFLLFLGSVFSLIFPFLTQNLIDKGINAKDLNIITLILLAQLGLFFGYISIEVLRNRLMLYTGTKISITILSDFLRKLLKLPIQFFETKMMGDFNQRIQDIERIEQFLTSQSLLTFFSILTFSVFFGVLWYYNFNILLIYILLTIISIVWSLFWLRRRKFLDYFRFQERSRNQESIYEIISGINEMKLNHFEDFKRNKWEEIQQKLFKINIRILNLDQIQHSGYEFINQVKNIFVTFMAAFWVVKGKMTLGELLGVSYIIGQMNSPVNQLIEFFRSSQEAKLSLDRLDEVHSHPDEEQNDQNPLRLNSFNESDGCVNGINLQNVSFQYEGPRSPFVLKNINLTIPEGKITAIVGASGSGKTTLLKLLLKFYDPVNGEIIINNENILTISPTNLRKNCGVVMQDGFIFSDSIERNIATGDEIIDKSKLRQAIKIANIEEFIELLPLKFNTKIGDSGVGISGGQKQRILIARAVYKDPHYIFFDEATSALDAENEKIIHDNLQDFFKGKTVIIIAHRLSTVKNADQIIVLKNGQVIEQGNHLDLVKNKTEYYHLVKNQLELGI